MASFCTRCGKPTLPDDAFCRACGAALAPQTADPPAPARVAERRPAHGGAVPSTTVLPSVPDCPKCGSQSVQAVAVARKDVNAAMLTQLTMGVAAGMAASQKTVIRTVCLKCGATWFPGTTEERHLRAMSGQLGETAKREAEDEVQRKKDKQSADLTLGCGGCVVAILILVFMVIAGSSHT